MVHPTQKELIFMKTRTTGLKLKNQMAWKRTLFKELSQYQKKGRESHVRSRAIYIDTKNTIFLTTKIEKGSFTDENGHYSFD